jgi:aspartate 1-decarboxylase
MHVTVLQSKIHRATVTDAQLHYQGSVTIDAHLLALAGLCEFQQVDIYNITNGNRLTTYTLKGEAHTGIIQINGAAAHLAKTGDLVIIAAYCMVYREEAMDWKPKLVFVDTFNKPQETTPVLMPTS